MRREAGTNLNVGAHERLCGALYGRIAQRARERL